MVTKRVASQRAVLIFTAISAPQPWQCYFCGADVAFQVESPGQGTRRETPVMHHIDGDHENNDPSNWAWAHNGCHVRYHMTGNIPSELTRKRQSEAAKGRVFGPRRRDNIARGSKEFQRVTRDKCDECGKVSTPQAIGSHQKHSGHQGKTRSKLGE